MRILPMGRVLLLLESGMSLNQTAKICMVLKNDSEVDLFKSILTQNKIKNITAFTNAEMAYETATRSQFDMFIVNLKLSDQPGIVLLQRLRNCGNYGLEPYLFVGESVDAPTLALFAEHDIEYIVTKPFTPDKIVNKIFYMIKQESSLSPAEEGFRQAKSALQSQMPDMAWEMAIDAVEKHGTSEKLELLMGDILLSKGEILKAREYYEKAEITNSESVAAKHKIASTYIAEKKFAEAKAILDKLADVNPHHIKLLENAGLSNYETGNTKKAKKYMSQVTKLDKENKAASSVITKVKIDEGNLDGLAKNLQTTHSEQEIVRLLNTAGVKLSKENKVEEAIKIYKDCLDVIENKEFAGKVHYNLALAYQKNSATNETVFHLQEAVKNIPTMEKAKAMLAKLKKPAA